MKAEVRDMIRRKYVPFSGIPIQFLELIHPPTKMYSFRKTIRAAEEF